jgi:hypothetical protein
MTLPVPCPAVKKEGRNKNEKIWFIFLSTTSTPCPSIAYLDLTNSRCSDTIMPRVLEPVTNPVKKICGVPGETHRVCLIGVRLWRNHDARSNNAAKTDHHQNPRYPRRSAALGLWNHARTVIGDSSWQFKVRPHHHYHYHPHFTWDCFNF